MKETVKINLAQRLFDLDEDAYIKLKTYLDSLKQYFSKASQEAEDILFDIEQRIAEILDEKLQNKKQVVTIQDIDEVILKMGTAEDFARDADFTEDTESQENDKTFSSDSYHKENRRLYRDADNNILGGVCQGLASYFNIDSLWIRLVFIVLLFVNGIGLIIYLILWVIVPPAVTRAQKLRMKGKPVNIENIEESVKTEVKRVKDKFSKYSESESYRRTKQTANDAARTIGDVVLVGIKVIAIIIGVGLAVAGLAILISFIAALTAGNYWNGWDLPKIHLGDQYLSVFENITLFTLALFLVIIIPIVAILAGLIRLIFNIRKGHSVLSAFAWTFWSLALVFVFITLIMGVSGTALGYHYKDNVGLDLPANKTLYLRMDDEKPASSRMKYYMVFGKEIIHDSWNDSFLLQPEVEIVKTNDLTPSMIIQYSALIPWEDTEREYYFRYSLNDSVLMLDNYWTLDEDDIWRLPRLKVIINLPESHSIHLDRDFKSVQTISDGRRGWPDWYFDSKLIMTEDGLESLD